MLVFVSLVAHSDAVILDAVEPVVAVDNDN